MCIGDFVMSMLSRRTSKKKANIILTNYDRFLQKNIPIIMVMGPEHCGKTTISNMLRACSQFTVIEVIELLHQEAKRHTIRGDRIASCFQNGKQVPDSIIIKVLKEEIVSSYITVKGFIIDGFPTNSSQVSHFKHKICKPSAIIYLYLNLDALFARMVAQNGCIDLDKLRIQYIRQKRKTESVGSKFDDVTYKLFNAYPPEHTCNRIIEHLEDNYGYKFTRIEL